MEGGSRIADFRDGLLSWLVSHLEHLRVHPPHERAESTIGGSYDRSKAFGELALLWRIAKRFPRLEHSDEFVKIHQHIATHAYAAIQGIQQSDSFSHCLRASLALEACGMDPQLYRPHVIRTFVRHFRDSDQWQGWSFIEIKYYLNALGVDNNIPDFGYLFSRSRMRLMPEITSLRRSDVYEMAHTIFCISDFGHSDVRPILDGCFAETCDYVGALLTYLTQREDWDLVAEVIVCCACLGYQPGSIVDSAWEGLMAAQPRLAAQPRPSGEGGDCVEPVARSRHEREFADRYHTTVVTLIAAILELEMPKPAPAKPTAGDDSPSHPERSRTITGVLSAAGRDQGRPSAV